MSAFQAFCAFLITHLSQSSPSTSAIFSVVVMRAVFLQKCPWRQLKLHNFIVHLRPENKQWDHHLWHVAASMLNRACSALRCITKSIIVDTTIVQYSYHIQIKSGKTSYVTYTISKCRRKTSDCICSTGHRSMGCFTCGQDITMVCHPKANVVCIILSSYC